LQINLDTNQPNKFVPGPWNISYEALGQKFFDASGNPTDQFGPGGWNQYMQFQSGQYARAIASGPDNHVAFPSAQARLAGSLDASRYGLNDTTTVELHVNNQSAFGDGSYSS